jgi:sec-independent protein translocase protein TatA
MIFMEKHALQAKIRRRTGRVPFAAGPKEALRKMLSAPDIAILGAVALLVFGPEQLPRVARKFGSVMRDVQNTSQQFIREMERAAEEHEPPADRPHLEAVPSVYDQTADETDETGQTDSAPEPEPPAPVRRTAEPAEF